VEANLSDLQIAKLADTEPAAAEELADHSPADIAFRRVRS